jgi:hypothetical protein
MQNVLDAQIEDYEKKVETWKRERSEATMSHELPGTLPVHLQRHPRQTKEQKQKELMMSLGYQIRTNEETKFQERERKIREEKEYLDHVAMEIDLSAAIDRADHLRQQHTLLESWEREGHLRNIDKLKEAGKAQEVTEYIREHLDVPVVSSKSLRMSKMISGGVGFDPRAKK